MFLDFVLWVAFNTLYLWTVCDASKFVSLWIHPLCTWASWYAVFLSFLCVYINFLIKFEEFGLLFLEINILSAPFLLDSQKFVCFIGVSWFCSLFCIFFLFFRPDHLNWSIFKFINSDICLFKSAVTLF